MQEKTFEQGRGSRSVHVDPLKETVDVSNNILDAAGWTYTMLNERGAFEEHDLRKLRSGDNIKIKSSALKWFLIPRHNIANAHAVEAKDVQDHIFVDAAPCSPHELQVCA